MIDLPISDLATIAKRLASHSDYEALIVDRIATHNDVWMVTMSSPLDAQDTTIVVVTRRGNIVSSRKQYVAV